MKSLYLKMSVVFGVFLILLPCAVFGQPITVPVDIKPGGCENPLNVKSKGVLPVAILGTADFDVTTIDRASIRMVTDPADTDGLAPIRSRVEDVATPPAAVPACPNTCSDAETGPDGYPDLTLKFKTQDVVELLGAVSDGDCVVLYLKGISGNTFLGQDVVLILKKGKKKM